MCLCVSDLVYLKYRLTQSLWASIINYYRPCSFNKKYFLLFWRLDRSSCWWCWCWVGSLPSLQMAHIPVINLIQHKAEIGRSLLLWEHEYHHDAPPLGLDINLINSQRLHFQILSCLGALIQECEDFSPEHSPSTRVLFLYKALFLLCSMTMCSD